MKSTLATCLAGLALIAGSSAANAADTAPANPPVQMIPGLAVVNVPEVVAQTNAFKSAQQQRKTTYKSQLDAADARSKAINAQLAPLVAKFNTDRAAAKPDQASLRSQATEIQRIRNSGQAEVNRILAPVAMSEAYVNEQIADAVNKAVAAVMAKRGFSLVVAPGQVMAFNNGYNANALMVAEVNALLPTAKLTPPADWKPKNAR